jgi:alanine racemase
MAIRPRVDRALQHFETPLCVYNRLGISRGAILHNFDMFQALVPSGFVFPVLKANAYGHGLAEVANILKARQFPYLAVDGYFEALQIQDVSSQPVLVMGAVRADNFQRLSYKNLAFVVHDAATLAALGSTGKRIKIHLEIDTGMHRHGIQPRSLGKFLGLLGKYPRLELEGVMSHLADADNPSDTSYTLAQTLAFDEAVAQILAAGYQPKYFHLANSAGSPKASSRYANALRPGISLYGISPLEPSDQSAPKLAALAPALELTSTITKTFVIEKGETVSYGRTFTAQQKTRIGVLPLGYYEALPRSLSNHFQVQYGKKYLPQAGRICMNHTMLDLTGSRAKTGDEVTIISRDSSSQNSLANICQRHNLFSYELLVNLSPTIRRTIVA